MTLTRSRMNLERRLVRLPRRCVSLSRWRYNPRKTLEFDVGVHVFSPPNVRYTLFNPDHPLTSQEYPILQSSTAQVNLSGRLERIPDQLPTE